MRSAFKRTARRAAGLAAVLTLLGAAPASAGLLRYDGATDTLIYLHFLELEAPTAHDVRVTVDGSDVRLTDALAEVTVHPSPRALRTGAMRRPARRTLSTSSTSCSASSPTAFTNDTGLFAFACGEGGNDTIAGGSTRDVLGGGRGRDELLGRGGNDTLAISLPDLCETGDDVRDAEVLDGGDGLDQLHGGPGDDVLVGGDGDDILRGYAGDDRMSGGAGRDDAGGFEGDDRLSGGTDDDWLFGGGGNDWLEGGEGDDLLGVSATVDLDGPTGSDAVATMVETGDDMLDGGGGDDLLIAGPGERVLNFEDPLSFERRGARDRTLQSAAANGADVMRGGGGRDEVTYFNRTRPVHVTPDGIADDGSEGERDRVDADVEVISGGAGDDVLTARPDGSTLFGDLGADRLAGTAGPDQLYGGNTDAATDVLTGGGGDDVLGGGGGGDQLDGGPGADMLSGDDGEDRLRGETGADTLAGGTGSDRLEGGQGDDCLHGFLPSARQTGCPEFPAEIAANGADGDDTLNGGAGADRLDGGGGEDVADYTDATGPVFVALAGVDSGPWGHERPWADRDVIAADVEGARGGPRGDTLLGNGGDNLLDGGPGDDHLDGGAGADRLHGGPGRDLVLARDAGLDELRCGTGRDLAVIDPDDELVALRADICELIDAGPGGDLARVLGSPACPRAPAVAGHVALVPRARGHRRAVPHACAQAAMRNRRPAAGRAGGERCAR